MVAPGRPLPSISTLPPASSVPPKTVRLPLSVSATGAAGPPARFKCATASVQGGAPLKFALRAVASPDSVVGFAPLLKHSVSLVVGTTPAQFAAFPRAVLTGTKRVAGPGFQVRGVGATVTGGGGAAGGSMAISAPPLASAVTVKVVPLPIPVRLSVSVVAPLVTVNTSPAIVAVAPAWKVSELRSIVSPVPKPRMAAATGPA